MKQGVVLALDLATTTGWAWHRPGMPRPYFGAFRLPGNAQEVGQAGDALERWLRDLFIVNKSEGGISHIFFEAQHLAGGKMNIDTIYKLISLGGITEKFGYQIGAKVYKVHISEWRKHFIGRGSGFGSVKDAAKNMAVARCAEYGWHTDVHDAAEACGILDFALTMIPEYHRPWRDAVLMKGR
jgi:hypothetical protein